MQYQITAFDAAADEAAKTLARRQQMYSPQALKIAYCVDRTVVSHNDFTAGLCVLDRAFQLSREFSIPRGVCLVGPPGSGKTLMLQYYLASLPKSDFFQSGLGALVIRLPERPSVGWLVSALLTKLKYPLPRVSVSTVGSKRPILLEALMAAGTRLVCLDGADHLCSTGIRKAQNNSGNEATELLCEMADEARVALALAGGERLCQLEQVDSSLAARATVLHRIKNFESGSYWRGFLAAFAKQTSEFDLSSISQPDQARLLHQATKGNPRMLKSLLIEVVLIGIDKGAQKPDAGDFSQAFLRVFGKDAVETNPWLRASTATLASQSTVKD